MARHRTIDGKLWTHPVIQKTEMYVGWLYAYIITERADDEGRFIADAWSLAEHAFSSTFNLGEEQAQQALDYLAEHGLILLYDVGGQHYGFLTGWHEHQYIREPNESALPKPPVAVASWEVANAVRAQYAEAKGIQSLQQVRFDDALAWAKRELIENEVSTSGLPAVNDPSTTRQRPVDEEVTTGQPELNSTQLTSKDSLSGAASPAPDVATPKPSRKTIEAQLEVLREPLPNEDIVLLDEYMDLLAAENKSGKLTIGRRLSETHSLLTLRDGNGQTVGIGAQPWRYGMSAANANGAPNPNYVKKAAGSWSPQSSGGNSSGGSRARQAEDSYPRGVAIPSKPEEFGEGQVDWAKAGREAENDSG